MRQRYAIEDAEHPIYQRKPTVTAKHSPATSLPWKELEVYGRGGCVIAGLPICRTNTQPDAAYIVHAANAYPRAIELLQYCADHAGIGNPLKGSIQSFLKDIGEGK